MTSLPLNERTSRAAPDTPRVSPSRRRTTVAAWLLVGALAVVCLQGPLTYDFRENPVRGDQASHLLQALSLAYDNHTLNFSHANHARWQRVGWDPEPSGLFFQRYDGDRWAFAKPYGYSVYLTPFIALAGPVTGAAIANTALVLLLIGVTIALLRRRYRGPAVPLVVAAMYLTSYAYLYAYVLHTELFLALLVLCAFGAVLMYRDTRSAPWALVAVVLMSLGVAEKVAFAALFVPVLAAIVWTEQRRALRIALPVTFIAAFAVFVVPYLYYSDFKSITPYGGERYYASSAVPFAAGADERTGGYSRLAVGAGETATLQGPVEDKLLAAAYYVVGRHTGMLPFIPMALFLIGAALARMRRSEWLARAALLGVLAYIGLYVVMFPLNFYGGGQSLGNRYFLQIAPAAVVVAMLAGVPRRWMATGAVVSLLIGAVVLWPHHTDPDHAYIDLSQTSPLQRVLPFESNQDYVPYFECGATVC